MKKSELLNKVSDYEIFRYYLGEDFSLGEMMSSPFRKDNNPSFNIFKHYKGELVFKDFAHCSGDCIRFVMELFNLNRREAFDKISEDFDITEDRKPIRPIINERKKTEINIETQPFLLQEIIYWYSYGIEYKQLNKYDVHSLKGFQINNSKWFTSRGHCYAYILKKDIKIYKPFDTEGYKWITNCNGGWQGWEQLPIAGGIVVITKSLKDIMVLDTFGIPSVAPHGEGMILPPEDVKELKRRFKRVYVLYDCDKAGYEQSELICKEYALKRVFVNNNYCIFKNKKNEIKDISDFRQSKGYEKTREFLTKELSL